MLRAKCRRAHRRLYGALTGALLAAVLSIMVAAPSASATNGAMAWGLDTYGELGVAATRVAPPYCSGRPVCEPIFPNVFSPAAVAGLNGASSIAAGFGQTLAVLEDGTVEAWGRNTDGQLGIGDSVAPEECWDTFEDMSPCVSTPVAVPGLSGVKEVAAGAGHSLALLENGTVMAWGENADGQLGDGSTSGPEVCEQPGTTDPHVSCSTTPLPVKGLSGVKAIAAGESDSFALLANGTVMSWGANDWGQLGNAGKGQAGCPGQFYTCEPTPAAIPALTGVDAIAAGSNHALALLTDGTVVAWGMNNAGELGDGTQQQSAVPVSVSGLAGVAAIGAGSDDSIALLRDGTVMDWGSNSEGELGDGSANGPEKCRLNAPDEPCSQVPVAVSGLTGVKSVAAGYAHNLALLEDGTVMAWGYNEYGALGTGTIGPESCEPPSEAPRCSRTPVQVGGLTGVTAIAVNAGWDDSVAYGPLTPTVTGVEGTEAESAPAGMQAHAEQSGAGNTGSELGGTTVSVSGSDFSGATAVRFGTRNAASFTVSESGEIAAISPPGTGTVNITVTTPRGESPIAPGDEFRYTPPVPPTVKKLAPKSGPAGGGTEVQITGTGLSTATEVWFGSVGVREFARSSTSIYVTAPAGTAGDAAISVSSPSGTSAISAADRFDYKGPTITALSPDSGPPTGVQAVTITGSGFATGDTGTTFRFGRTAAGHVECTSTTSCSVLSPAGKAGTVDVTAAVGARKSKKTVPAGQYTYG